MKTLQHNIMRRVYYAYGLKIATHPLTAYTVVLVALVWWLKELVFFARIWESVMARPVSELGSFAVSLITRADLLTLLVCAALLVLTVLVVRTVATLPLQHLFARPSHV